MEREGNGGEEKKEFMEGKLQRRLLVGERGEHCTTPSSTWRLDFPHEEEGHHYHRLHNFPTTSVSARKLGATMWEISPIMNMSKNGDSEHRHRRHKNKGFEPRITTVKRSLASPPIQHQRSIERNGHDLKPVSPANYSSSMEVAEIASASSLEYKGRNGNSNHTFNTSTELLKVLNRIWTLEEQHALNKTIVKSMKNELHQSRAQIKELLQEKYTDHPKMNKIMKKVAENNLVTKNMEQDQSLKDELEGEKKLRKISENLHKKLSREITEIKSSFYGALKELENEKKTRVLLEDLCDEFATGVKDYEQELRLIKQNPDKDYDNMKNQNRPILHISESWLDDRIQLKLAESRNNLTEKHTIDEKLQFEIENFLQAKKITRMRKNGNFLHRCSSESFLLNEAISAPQNAGNDSTDTDDFELSKCNGHDFEAGMEKGILVNYTGCEKSSKFRNKFEERNKTKFLDTKTKRVGLDNSLSLKSKLLKARLEGQNSQSKAS